VLDALVAAGIPFEEALYPREKHGFKPEANKHFYARRMEFFERELGSCDERATRRPAPTQDSVR